MIRQWIISGCLLTTLFSCAALQAPVPQGFAKYEQSLGERSMRAVSPEGVTWRVSEAEQEESASLSFWKDAVRKRLVDGGYRIVDSLQFQAQGREGFAWESMAPLGEEDFMYLVAVQLDAEKVLITEASGSLKAYQLRKSAMLESLGKNAAAK